MKGGSRPGAGRKPGVPNKRTLELQRQAAARPATDTPLAFLLNLMNDPDATVYVQLDAAKAAALYMHPRLTSVTLKGDEDEPIRHVFEWASEPNES